MYAIRSYYVGDPQIWLNINEQISADELIKSITIGNANDACVVLAEAISKTEDDFVKLMNAKANELHMDNTVFLNSTGIEAEGQFSTSYDLALLSKELLNYRITSYNVCYTKLLRIGTRGFAAPVTLIA